MTKKFPIQDIQYHEERLREVASAEMSQEEGIAVAWHSTAIAYLMLGEVKGIQGPAAEYECDGRVVVSQIQDYLIPTTDSHGLTFFKHVFKENSA